MIDFPGQGTSAAPSERPPAGLRDTRMAAGGDFPPVMRGPLEVIACQFRARLGATNVAILWQEDRGSAATCIAASGDLPAPPAVRLVADRIVSTDQEASPMRIWRHLDGATSKQVQVDFQVASGLISVVAVFADDNRSRGQIDPILDDLVPETASFFSLCGIALEALTTAARLREVVNLSGVGVIIVDGQANVLFANDAAERVCEHSKALRLTDGTLRAMTLHDSLRLQAAIEHVGNAAASSKADVPVIAITRPRAWPLMVTVSPLSRQSAGREQGGAILSVFDPQSDIAAIVRPACDFYRLSAMEGKLAQIMADGISVTEAAIRLGLKEHTARSYLKQVFQKTGTNRQGELVALLLRTAVHCAPKRNMSLID